MAAYPVRHVVGVGLPVVVVQDHDGGHHTAGHHEHDAVEVGSQNYHELKCEVEQSKCQSLTYQGTI